MNTSSPDVVTMASVVSPTLDVVTIAEAAELLRCKPWPVRQMVTSGRLPAARPLGDAGPWLIQHGDLAGLLAAS